MKRRPQAYALLNKPRRQYQETPQRNRWKATRSNSAPFRSEPAFRGTQARDLTVLGFPCNQFGGPESGTSAEIKNFRRTTFHVPFRLCGKIEVNGVKRHALYTALAGKDSPFPGNISGEFGEFFVDRDGLILQRCEAAAGPDSPEMIEAIEAALRVK